MAEDEKSGRGSTWAEWVAVVLAVYVLSFGPFVALYVRLGCPNSLERVLLCVYYPILVFGEAPGIGPLIQDYFERWEEIGLAGHP